MSVAGREVVRTFACFGSTATVRVGGAAPDGRPASLAAVVAEARLLDVHRRLSRFDPASELSRCNADPRPVVPASRLLRLLAGAAVRAGERSGGLVDATLVGPLERAGYAASRAGAASLELAEAVALAPPPRPAGPDPDAAWRTLIVDDGAGTIARTPGVRLDSGGLAKGLAADLVARGVRDHATFVVDCAGDLRIGGRARRPRRIRVEDPFGGAPVHELRIADGAVATSGVGRRSWLAADGTLAHHIVDPASGRPAWTGVVQATALAPTALEAEILAKAALLSGPTAGRAALVHGGVLVLADGEVDVVEAAASRVAT